MAERTYLDDILAWHRMRAATDERSIDELLDVARHQPPPRGFARAISASPHLAVIAEIKRRSPSKGDLNAGLDPAVMARRYQSGGAACLSVLTDSRHFGGSVADLQEARAACDLPVIRKDFTVDARDVCDARIMGADCVLLIAAALSVTELGEMLDVARRVDIDVLVEVHDEVELSAAIDAGATMVGVNQRDLVTFAVDQDRAVRMGSLIPAHLVKVAESGVRGRHDAEALRAAGYHAVLVGEHLVTAQDPSAALTDLLVD
jgi:indole-3-glycerol phosphate synthase